MVGTHWTPMPKGRKLIDLTGKQFGQWTVIQRGPILHKRTYSWECRCSCGTVATLETTNLKRGTTSKCPKCRGKQLGDMNTKHGAARASGFTTEYRSWNHLREKCVNASNPAYPRFGGRGVTMHPRWVASFKAFLDDMGERPSPKHILERVEETGHYEPGNCVWLTKSDIALKKAKTRIP